MHLDLVRDKAVTVPTVVNPSSVSSLRIWYCEYKTLTPIAMLSQLKTLVIAGFPDANLGFLGELRNLEYLRILHLPRVVDLSPLARLQRLETLCLETLPSWDSSSKTIEVESLAPLIQIQSLKHLSLFGVLPKDRSLADLERCSGLHSARVSKYPRREEARFYAATGLSDAQSPEPIFDGA